MYYNRGLANACLVNYEAARYDFGQGIKLNPFVPDLLHIRGLCSDYLDETPKALRDYFDCLLLKPNFVEAINHYELAIGKLYEPNN